MSAATARRYLLGGALLSLLTSTHAFYLPGAAPHDYYEGERVNLFVNALTPMLAGTEHAKLVSTLPIYGPNYEVHDVVSEEIPYQLYALMSCPHAPST